MRIMLVGLILPLAVPACGVNYGVQDIASVPDNPTYWQDVRPLLHDHCTLCHGSPPDRGAPATFRLDVYPDTNGLPGVQSMAGSILHDALVKRMPPGVGEVEGIGPNGTAMLQKWVDNGKPE